MMRAITITTLLALAATAALADEAQIRKVVENKLGGESRAVWCSPDRAKAWLDVALRGKPPTAKSSCANPVEKNLELGRTLGVNSTPTLILANGERITGGLSRADLTDVLDGKR